MSPRGLASFLLFALLAFRAEALPVQARYPFELQVELSKDAASAEYSHGGPGFLNAPSCEASVTFVGRQTREAYAAFRERLFQPGGQPTLVLQVEAVRPGVDLRADGWYAVTAHDVALREPSGAVLGRWTVRGFGRVEGREERALPEAFSRAAASAIQQLESRLEEPPEVASWLQRNGVATGAVARRPAAAEPLLPAPVAPPSPARLALLAFFDGGVGANAYSMWSDGVGEMGDVAAGVDARLGMAGKWAFAQVGFSWWQGRTGDLEHALTSIGVDAGPLMRFSPEFEMEAGVGIHSTWNEASAYNQGPQRLWVRDQEFVPSVLAAIRLTPSLGRYRLRFSVEGRLRFNTFDSTVVERTPRQAPFTEHLTVGQSFAFLFGGELPLGSVMR